MKSPRDVAVRRPGWVVHAQRAPPAVEDVEDVSEDRAGGRDGHRPPAIAWAKLADAAAHLAAAGSILATWEALEHDPYQLAKSQAKAKLGNSAHSIEYTVCATLNGPNGPTLQVATVWISLAGMACTNWTPGLQ
jgi:hypothetical protein